MTHITLTAAKREKAGKGVSRSLRRENRIPAVIYGDSQDPVLISLYARDVNVIYNKGNMLTTLTQITLDGKTHEVIARDVHCDPVMDFVMHVDFLRVSPKTRIDVKVPISFINHENSVGLQKRGTLKTFHHEIAVNCQATQIPEYITVDLTGLDWGKSIRIKDITLPEGVRTPAKNQEVSLATIIAPRKA